MAGLKPFALLLLLAISSTAVRLPREFAPSPFNVMDCIILPAALFCIGFYLYRRLGEWLYYPYHFGLRIWFHRLVLHWRIQWEWIRANRLRQTISASYADLDQNNGASIKYRKSLLENIAHWENQLKTHNTIRRLYEDELKKILGYEQEIRFLLWYDDLLNWRIFWWWIFPYYLESDPRQRLEKLKSLSDRLHRFCEQHLLKECDRLYARLEVNERRRHLKAAMDDLGIS